MVLAHKLIQLLPVGSDQCLLLNDHTSPWLCTAHQSAS